MHIFYQFKFSLTEFDFSDESIFYVPFKQFQAGREPGLAHLKTISSKGDFQLYLIAHRGEFHLLVLGVRVLRDGRHASQMLFSPTLESSFYFDVC